jgi:hypothetical protein
LLYPIPDSNQKIGFLPREYNDTMLSAAIMLMLAILATAGPLNARTVIVVDEKQHPQGLPAELSQPETRNVCGVSPEIFELKTRDLPVFAVNGGVLFGAGMTIDADGAPNAYGPKNRGLDYTANARNASGWVALVTDTKGHPVVQKRGPYRGYYVSTTSLEHMSIQDPRDPRKYLDARRIPYIALPADFARRFGISLGDLAVVVNNEIGRSAYAVYGDVGPKGRIGEGSIALANKLKIPSNPRRDSVPDGVTYLVFPGSRSRIHGSITSSRINASGSRLYRAWLADKNCPVQRSTP